MGRVISGVCDCVCVCVSLKEKQQAINTKLGMHILYGRISAQKVKVIWPLMCGYACHYDSLDF